MIIYPALDLRGGQVVRLKQGDPAQQTMYSSDPVATAMRWQAQGAGWLHVVNLDGALSAANDNEAVLRKLADLAIGIQFGGGLRSAEDVDRAFDLGATRVVIGTLAVTQPELVYDLIAKHGADRIAIALDARNGFVTTHGWQQGSSMTPLALAKFFAEHDARNVLYTDVGRDGLLSGVDVSGTAELARETGLDVIASGGVRDLADIQALHDTKVIAGVILGTALYEGKIALVDALRVGSANFLGS